MAETLNIRTVLAKAARILLVFALVFYTSLRVELLVAFAADGEFDMVTVDDGVEGHEENDEIVDLLIYQRVQNADPDAAATWKPVAKVRATEAETQTVNLASFDGEQQFIAVPVWNGDDMVPKEYADPDADPVSEITSAKVKWFVDDPKADSEADSEERNLDSEFVTAKKIDKNILSITPKAAGSTVVSGELDEAVEGGPLAVKFNVKVEEPVLSVLDAEGAPFPEDVYAFKAGELPEEGYQFTGKLTLSDAAFANGKSEYNYPADGSLAEFSDGALGDLTWEISGGGEPAEDEEPAEPTIENGLLDGVTVVGTYTVTCAVKDAAGAEVAQASLELDVSAADSDDPAAPTITTLDILDKAGEPVSPEDGLTISSADSEASAEERLTYQLQARAVFSDESSYRFPSDGELLEFSKQVYDNLEWSAPASVEGEDSIDELIESGAIVVGKDDGTLSLGKEAAGAVFSVTCTAPVHASENDADEAESESVSGDSEDAKDSEGTEKVVPEEKTATVTIRVSEDAFPSDPVKIKSVELLDENGSAFSDGQDLTFGKDELPKEYAFQVRAEVENLAFADGGSVYESGKNGNLSDFSNGALNLTWSLVYADDASKAVSEDDATIADGVLKVKKEGKYKVVCTVEAVESTEKMPDELTVIAGDGGDSGTKDPQGDSQPQDTLTITSDKEFATKDSTSSKTKAAKLKSSYSRDDLLKMGKSGELAFALDDYSMKNSSGARTEITGYGFAVTDLLAKAFAEANVDFEKAPIESVDFVDCNGNATSLSWSALKDASAQLADQSYVHVDAAASTDGSNGDSAEASESTASLGKDPTAWPDYTNNTRYRLLFNSTSSTVDPDALRYITAIKVVPVEGESTSSDDESKNDESKNDESKNDQEDSGNSAKDDFKVNISYTPVPMGVTAEFVAAPSYSIKGSWNCVWEKKDQETGEISIVKGETGQVLRVPTSKSTVGDEYRVTVDNERKGVEEHLGGTSEWKKLEEGKRGLVLSYDPPIAGQLAIFRASVYDYEGDVSKLEYVWEWSDDGGTTWKQDGLEGEKKSTLKIPTYPIDENSSTEDSDASLVYIRVRAYTNDKSEREKYMPKNEDGTQCLISNVQPLTVRVGDKDTDPEDSKPKNNPEVPPVTKDPKKVTEIETITIEPDDEYDPQPDDSDDELDEDVDDDFDGEPVDFEDDDEAPAEITDLYINDSVTEAVNEQEAAAAEYAVSTTPGARWTELKTMNPTSDDVRRVLGDNPFAPLVIPFTLGITAAGGVEKLLFFRRQVK